MLHKDIIEQSGFRTLEPDELEAVGGGNNPFDQEPIDTSIEAEYQRKLHRDFLMQVGAHILGDDPNDNASKGGEGSDLCPEGHICIPEGPNGMFERSTTDGKLYFTPEGLERFNTSPDIDHAAVFVQLLKIAGYSLAGIGASAVNVIGATLGITMESIGSIWFSDD